MVLLQYAFLLLLFPICYIFRLDTCLIRIQNADIYRSFLAPWTKSIATFITSYTIAMQGFATSLMRTTLSHATEPSKSTTNETDLDTDDSSSSTPSLDRRSLEAVAGISSQPSRSKTIYHIAHPAPVAHVRPKLILQFLTGSTHLRPVPAFNVIPARALKSTRKLPKFLRRKTGLMEHDLVVFHAEDHSIVHGELTHLLSDNNEQDLKVHGESLGVICPTAGVPLQNTVTEISLNDNSVWQGGLLNNGNYEFIMVNSSVQIGTVRWVPRRSRTKKPKSEPHGDSSGNDQRSRFTFSCIDPDVRKHPILGILDNTTQTLKIYDHYNAFSVLFDSTHSVPLSTTERLRSLIILTGTWVALNEGWSTLYTSMKGESIHRVGVGGQIIHQLSTQDLNQNWLTPTQNSIHGSRLTPSPVAPSSVATHSSSFKAAISRLEGKVNEVSTPSSRSSVRNLSQDIPGPVMSTGPAFMGQYSASKSQHTLFPASYHSGEMADCSSMEGTSNEPPAHVQVYQPTNTGIAAIQFSERYSFKGSQQERPIQVSDPGSMTQIVDHSLVPSKVQLEANHASGIVYKIRDRLRSLKVKIHGSVKRL